MFIERFIIKFLFTILLIITSGFCLATPDSSLLRKLDLQRGLFSDNYQTFELGEQSTIYVLNENTNAITRGVAVLVADSGTPIVAHSGFANLAEELNKIGWVTILLPAPATELMLDAAPNVSETENTSNDSDTEINTDANLRQSENSLFNLNDNKTAVSTINDQAFVTHEQQLVVLLNAVIEKSQEYPGFFLVISQGTSAAWLSKIYAENKLGTPDAFVAISPYWPDRSRNQQLPEWLANTSMPVLDLHSQADNKWAQNTVSQREIAATKSLKLQYRQRELLGFNLYKQHNAYISKEIYGWLSYMGW